MRPKVLEIAWHETQAVYSVDFQPLPASQLKRLLPTAEDDSAPSGGQGQSVRERSGSAVSSTPAPMSGTGASASASPNKEKDERSVQPGASSSGAGGGASAQALGRSYRMATAGGDSKVRIWMVHPNIPTPNLAAHAAATGQELAPHPPRTEYLATLSKHTAPVNVVRFSPNGQTLASAGDDGNVILWVPSDRPIATFGETTDEVDKEHWRLQKMLQVTTKHVYDLAWSPDGEFFIAGSTDNTATIWKAATGECVFALREHAHNVQGVSWDPLNEYIATQSSDRSVHVNTFAFRGGVPDVHPVSRATRMEIRHSRTPSFPSGVRPHLPRRGSAASDAGSAITIASEMPEFPAHSSSHGAAPATPSASIPSTPQPAAAMNPPTSTKPGSRRSSFSGSQAAGSPALSAAAFPGRGRSPSPIPPLPAIRAPSTSAQAISQRLYGDESTTRFFRRLSFSPDGSLLLTPAGQIEDQLFKGSPMMGSRSLSHDGADGAAPGAGSAAGPSSASASASGSATGPARPKATDNGKPTVFIYSRANLARAPIAHLPGHKTASVAIKFSPIFYDLRTGGGSVEPKHVTLDKSDPQPVQVSLSMPPPPPPSISGEKKEKDDKPTGLGSVFALPYRLVYAVACQDSVLLYDTQQPGPIAIFRGLHYAGFNDIAWSPDGQTLMLCSSDGYCSVVVFDLGELGTVHPTQQHHRQLAAIAQSHSHAHSPLHPASTPSATPVPTQAHRESFSQSQPQSPAVSSVLRQSPAPARSEREGSASSSVAYLGPSQSSTLPLFNPPLSTASSTASASVTDVVLPTPGDEVEGYGWGKIRSGSESSASASAAGQYGVGMGLGLEGDLPAKRGALSMDSPGATGHAQGQAQGAIAGHGRGDDNEKEKEKEGGAKKKRRVALTHLGEDA